LANRLLSTEPNAENCAAANCVRVFLSQQIRAGHIKTLSRLDFGHITIAAVGSQQPQ